LCKNAKAEKTEKGREETKFKHMQPGNGETTKLSFLKNERQVNLLTKKPSKY
jgi:hypothetical protein